MNSPQSIHGVVLAAAIALFGTQASASNAKDADEAADKIGPENRAIATLAGHWNVRQTYWSTPNAPPAIDTGTATFTAVLGGRHVRQELHIQAAGKPVFDGLGYIGYDRAAGTYYSSWRDVNFTGVILATGRFDARTRTYTFTGEISDASGGKKLPLREVLRIVDDNHFTYQYFETRERNEALAVQLDYTRVD